METKEQIKQLFHLVEKLREYKGINKKELAAKADITPQYYSQLLNAEKTPSIAIVILLLNALDAELKPVFK